MSNFTIFLDVDGVLNNWNYTTYRVNKDQIPYSCNRIPFDPRSLHALKFLINHIPEKVDIVISSTWRKDEEDMVILESKLREYGLQINGETKDFCSNSLFARGEEIEDYIKENKIKDFIIIDDVDNMLPTQLDKMILTNFDFGLTMINVLDELKKREIKVEIIKKRG